MSKPETPNSVCAASCAGVIWVAGDVHDIDEHGQLSPKVMPTKRNAFKFEGTREEVEAKLTKLLEEIAKLCN